MYIIMIPLRFCVNILFIINNIILTIFNNCQLNFFGVKCMFFNFLIYIIINLIYIKKLKNNQCLKSNFFNLLTIKS